MLDQLFLINQSIEFQCYLHDSMSAMLSTVSIYIGETKRRLKDRFNEYRRPILNPSSYIHTAVAEHLLGNRHSDAILLRKRAMRTLFRKPKPLSL